jgi:(p)ppGpp synthase/HD superfamily hydrolase
MDIAILQAAVLHDTVEDTHTTVGKFCTCAGAHRRYTQAAPPPRGGPASLTQWAEEIAHAFGVKVATIVAECTDNVELAGPERKLEQLRTAPLKSPEAQQVKLAE